MTIKFFQPPVAPGTVCLSPFCAKLDMILQMSGVDFERHVEGDPRQGPKQKVPFIEERGKLIGDSHFIEQYLRTDHNVDLQSSLSDTERAIGNMIMSSVEEKLYWVLVYSRWSTPENAAVMKSIFFGHMPDAQMREQIGAGAEEMINQTLNGQGTGRHSYDEVMEIGKRIIDDLAILLGNQRFFFGDQPTSIDASVFGALANFCFGPVNSPVNAHIRAKPNLVAYMDRISNQFFPSSEKLAA